MSRPITCGDDDRGASEIADTPVAESVATVTAKKSSAFIVDVQPTVNGGKIRSSLRRGGGEDTESFQKGRLLGKECR